MGLGQGFFGLLWHEHIHHQSRQYVNSGSYLFNFLIPSTQRRVAVMNSKAMLTTRSLELMAPSSEPKVNNHSHVREIGGGVDLCSIAKAILIPLIETLN